MFSEPSRATIITHLHSIASSGSASELHPRISTAIKAVDGEDTDIAWSECYTPIERVLALLEPRPRVQMVLLTDHMRALSHRHPPSHLEAAARQHRLALGAELATCTTDHDGRICTGPEILAYGSPELVSGPAGPYHGLSPLLLEELYDTCLDPIAGELSTLPARDLLVRRGVAHALSHPFDGHALSLEGTFEVMGEFTFVEVVNGGFYAESTRVLDAFITLNNALIAGAGLPEEVLTPVGRRLVAGIRRRGRPLIAWSGSDAHSHALDRVVLAMAVPPGGSAESLGPADLFTAMLELDAAARHGGSTASAAEQFVTIGRPATRLSRLSDVLAIIWRNVHHNRILVRSPLVMARVLQKTVVITLDELRGRAMMQAKRRRALRRHFDPVRLLGHLEPAAPRASRPAGVVQPLPLARKQAPATAAAGTSKAINA